MTKLVKRLEGMIGIRCPRCGLKEWPSRFVNTQVLSWEEGTGWNTSHYRLIDHTHLTCGHTWTDKQYATAVDGFGG